MQAKIVHGYSQISLLAATQIMPCSCTIHAMSMNSFVSSCPWTVNVHVDPLTMVNVHEIKAHDFMSTEIWFMRMKFRLTPLFMHVHGHGNAWTGHEQGMNWAWSYCDMGIKSMKYEQKFPNFMGVARENLLYFKYEHGMNMPQKHELFLSG